PQLLSTGDPLLQHLVRELVLPLSSMHFWVCFEQLALGGCVPGGRVPPSGGCVPPSPAPPSGLPAPSTGLGAVMDLTIGNSRASPAVTPNFRINCRRVRLPASVGRVTCSRRRRASPRRANVSQTNSSFAGSCVSRYNSAAMSEILVCPSQ